ncbi:trigger factor [Allisonella histaminiformans]|uniref:trigger factor n=1 Tax=Allisonella histaminiformans TaxID=209880 RepID=UPI0026F0C811|nr:trigger factor [Allisonella histaminiformans]
MNVKVEALDQHKVKVTVEVPAADVVKGYKQAVSRFANQIRLKGFRKGKAPCKVLEMYLGKEAIEGEAKEIVFNRALEQALQNEKLVPVTQPEVKDESFSEKDGSTFTATFVKRPEVKLGEYKNLDAKHAEPVVTDDDVMAQLKQLAESNARLEVVEGAELKDGDFAIIDFKGTVNGVAFEGGEGKAYPLEIGSGSFIPGFEDQLKGHKAGDDVTVKVTFPANYFVKDLAGKEAEFAVHVNDVKQKVLPEINDEFAKSISKQDSLKDLMETMKAEMQGRATFQANQAYRQALVDLAVANAQIDIPQEMIDQRLDDMIDEIRQNIEAQGHSFEQYLKQIDKTEEDLRKDYTETAEKNVREGLVLNAIADKEDIHATDQDLSMEVFTMAQQFNADPNEVVKIIREQNRVGMLIDSVTRKKAANFLAEQAKKEEKPAAEKEEKAEAEKE